MKKMKRLMGLMLCVVLALGCLTGCGKSDEDILMAAVKAVNGAKSYDMETKMSGKMSMKVAEQSQDMDMTMDMTATMFTEPYKAKVSGTTSVMGQSTKVESYIQKEGEKFVMYMNSMGTWSKMEMDDFESALQSAGMNSIQSQLSEDISKYTKKEDRTEGEKSYLVYDYTVSADELKKMTEGMMGSMDSLVGAGAEAEQVEEMINKMMEDIGDMTMTILVDREEETIFRVEYSMTEMMNKMMKSLMEYLKNMIAEEASNEEEAAQMQEIYNSMEISVSDMNMTISYKNLNKAADFEIPEEAKNAEDMSSALGDLTGDAE